MAVKVGRPGVIDAISTIQQKLGLLLEYVVLPHHSGQTAEEQHKARTQCLEFMQGCLGDARRFSDVVLAEDGE